MLELLRGQKGFARQAIAAATLGAVAGSSFVGTGRVIDHLRPSHTVGVYKMRVTQQLPPPNERGALRDIDNDFRRALSVDTCKTRVTPKETLDMYKRLFGDEMTLPDDPKELNIEAQKALAEFDTAKSKLHFAKFPTETYEELYLDANSDTPEIPVDTYLETLRTYLAELGIEVVYNWQITDRDAPDPDIMDGSSTEKSTDRMDRVVIMNVLRSMSYMPKELLQDAGLDRVVLGDISDETALGMANHGSNDIYFDTAKYTNDQAEALRTQWSALRTATAHEVGHTWHMASCWQFIRRRTNNGLGRDNAMRSLSEGAIYTDDLKKGEQQPPRYISLLPDSGKGQVVFVEPYGRINELEDVATITANEFDGSQVEQLYTYLGLDTTQDGSKDRDITPVLEKQALIMARLHHQGPELADYYVALMRLGRLQAHTMRLIREAYAKSDAYKAKHKGLLDRGPTDPDRAGFDEIWRLINLYYDIYDIMSNKTSPYW